MEPTGLQYIVPLGAMNPWGHTLATDHIYFYHHFQEGVTAPPPFVPVPLTTPASGRIEAICCGGGTGVKVRIRATTSFVYVFDHIELAPGLGVGSIVKAGDPLGTSPGAVFDLGVINETRQLGFVNPARYSQETLHADSPLKYFDEPARSMLYAKVRRRGGDLDGRIDYDVDGTLAGNWFAEDLPVARSSVGGDMSVGTRQLAFARDVFAPDRQRISIGGLGMTGPWGVPPATPDFSTITPASGLVILRLLSTGEPGGPPGTDQVGLLLVQMHEAGRLRIEAVHDSSSRTAAFSGNARIYVR